MLEIVLTLLIAAMVLTLVTLFGRWIVARHLAKVGRIDPAWMNEILEAEKQAHLGHSPHGMPYLDRR
jgi:hypothetical protein